MVDEIAEVKRYLDGNGLEDSGNYYRACYMITKYYRGLGYSRQDTFSRVAEWVRKYNLTFEFSLIGCVSAAYASETGLRCGATVKISQADADCIRLYSRNRNDRKVALALMCCAKAFADEDGTFTASSGALASWLGMAAPNVRERQIRHLVEYGFVERVNADSSMHGWRKNYLRNAMCFRMKVPYARSGKWTLQCNDIRTLYEQIFDEPF